MPSQDPRPLRHLNTEDLHQLQHEYVESAEGTYRIGRRVALYDAIRAALADEAGIDQLAQAWSAYEESDPLPAIQPVTEESSSGLRLTPVSEQVWATESSKRTNP